jgi:hypothetical protein
MRGKSSGARACGSRQNGEVTAKPTGSLYTVRQREV